MSAGIAAARRAAEPVRFLLPRGVELALGQGHRHVDTQYLGTAGLAVDGPVRRVNVPLTVPVVDRAHFQTHASTNAGNAGLNEAAGKYFSDQDLARKQDSLYSQREFEQLQRYLHRGLLPARLRGVVYVRGGVTVLDGQQMQIAEGALITEGTVRLGSGSSLEVTHSAATRTLPAILALDTGALVLGQGARLRAHGLVSVSRFIDIRERARADVVGAMLSNDPGLSFRNLGTVVIRYDPAVLGTPGLRMADDAPAVAWVAAWQE